MRELSAHENFSACSHTAVLESDLNVGFGLGAVGIKFVMVLWRDHAPDYDHDVAAPLSLKRLAKFRHQRQVARGK